MMKEYILDTTTPFEYFHETFKEHLGETYGVMYQEDVIKIALHFAGVPASDGDVLRRAMSGKGRSVCAAKKSKDNFFACCAQKDIPSTESRNIQTNRIVWVLLCKAHRPLCR
jgi:DNA polymerase-3 subunit alpha/error-prone DNA polymerase